VLQLRIIRLIFPVEKKKIMRKKIVNTDKAPKAIGPYSQAIDISGALFVSGQLPLDPVTGNMITGGIREQTERVLKNIEAILTAAGYSKRDVVLCNCLLADMQDFQAMNEVYGAYFDVEYPARATFAVLKLPLGAMIEIEVIAMK
jgi:2-iminobutanoate/2-iminopropanoate deaminase